MIINSTTNYHSRMNASFTSAENQSRFDDVDGDEVAASSLSNTKQRSIHVQAWKGLHEIYIIHFNIFTKIPRQYIHAEAKFSSRTRHRSLMLGRDDRFGLGVQFSGR